MALGTNKMHVQFIETDEQVIYDNFKLLLDSREVCDEKTNASSPYGRRFYVQADSGYFGGIKCHFSQERHFL